MCLLFAQRAKLRCIICLQAIATTGGCGKVGDALAGGPLLLMMMLLHGSVHMHVLLVHALHAVCLCAYGLGSVPTRALHLLRHTFVRLCIFTLTTFQSTLRLCLLPRTFMT